MTVLGRKTHTSSMQVHQSAENWPGWRGPGGAQFVVSDPSLADSPQPHPGPSFSRLYIFLLISKGATAGNRFHMGSPGSVSTGPPPQPRAQTEVSQLRVKETQMVQNPSSQVWGHFELAQKKKFPSREPQRAKRTNRKDWWKHVGAAHPSSKRHLDMAALTQRCHWEYFFLKTQYKALLTKTKHVKHTGWNIYSKT